MRPLTVALDMDDTLYDLHGPWLAWVRAQQGCEFPLRDYWTAKLRPFVGYLATEGVFLGLRLLPGVREALSAVHAMGVRQMLVSTCVDSKTGAWEKQQAVRRDFPFLAREVVITSGAKDVIAADVLVDDGPHNLDAFPGITIRIPYVYNEHVSATYTMSDWSKYPALIASLQERTLDE